MSAIEFSAELQKRIEETGPVDLVVGVAGPVELDDLRAKTECLRGIAAKVVVTYPGATDHEPATEIEQGIQLAAYPMPSVVNSLAFWMDASAAYRSVLELASAWKANACMVLHRDMAALNAETVRFLTVPVLQGQSDLVMPVYPEGKYEGLINKSLLAPLSRALYGRRVRSPLPFDFCAGAKLIPKLAEIAAARAQNDQQLFWPSNTAALLGLQIGQAGVNVQHEAQTENVDLSAVLTELAGAMFEEAEKSAAYWQRARGSQPVLQFGNGFPAKEDAEPVDARPLAESFVLGSRNLEEVWRLVVPPATMLELKRLARLDVEQFRMPDALWARIIYDFALAHRMRRVSRTHVLGALTPLYLGWVASYTLDVTSATVQEADRRIEQLARVFEEQKAYFVSRWRWPERVS
jgi:glucosylglycerate synthase